MQPFGFYPLFSPHLPRTPDDRDIPSLRWRGCHSSTASFYSCAAGLPPSLREAVRMVPAPHAVTAPRSATFRLQACVDRSGQPVHHLLGLSILAARLIRSYMELCTGMPSMQLSRCVRDNLSLSFTFPLSGLFWSMNFPCFPNSFLISGAV